MIHQILSQSFPFYQQLSDEKKEKFQYRVQDFIKGRDFIGRNGHEVDVFQKVILAAFAIQLTFQFDRYMFPYFNTIVVHENSLDAAYKKRYSRKKIHMQGAMVFSWEHCLKGLDEEAFNWGIYEVAHCFYFEKFLQQEQYGNSDIQIEKLLESEQIEVSEEVPAFIQEYSTFNVQEKFAQIAQLKFSHAQLPLHLNRLMQTCFGF